MPARFKTEHDRRHADANPAEQSDDMQSLVGLRKKFDSAEINCCQQSGESDCTDVCLRELSSHSETDDGRQRQHYSQGCGFAAVAIAPKANPEIRNDQQKQTPKQRWTFCSSKDETPAAVQPDQGSGDINNRADRRSKQINNRNAEQQPDLHEIRERSLDLIRLTD